MESWKKPHIIPRCCPGAVQCQIAQQQAHDGQERQRALHRALPAQAQAPGRALHRVGRGRARLRHQDQPERRQDLRSDTPAAGHEEQHDGDGAALQRPQPQSRAEGGRADRLPAQGRREPGRGQAEGRRGQLRGDGGGLHRGRVEGKRQGWQVEGYLRREWLGQEPATVREQVSKVPARWQWQTTWSNGPKPYLRNRPAKFITRAEIVARLDAIKTEPRYAKGGPGKQEGQAGGAVRGPWAARHALDAIRRVFAWAAAGHRHGVEMSPAAGLSHDVVGLSAEADEAPPRARRRRASRGVGGGRQARAVRRRREAADARRQSARRRVRRDVARGERPRR